MWSLYSFVWVFKIHSCRHWIHWILFGIGNVSLDFTEYLSHFVLTLVTMIFQSLTLNDTLHRFSEKKLNFSNWILNCLFLVFLPQKVMMIFSVMLSSQKIILIRIRVFVFAWRGIKCTFHFFYNLFVVISNILMLFGSVWR